MVGRGPSVSRSICSCRISSLDTSVMNGSSTSNDDHDAAGVENGLPIGKGTDGTCTQMADSSNEEESASSTVHNERPVSTNGVDKEEEEEEEGSEEDEDEEDEEPGLKYERIGGDLAGILEKETASTIAVGAKLMVRTPTILAISRPLTDLGRGRPLVHTQG